MTYASPQNQIIASFGPSDRAKEKLYYLVTHGQALGAVRAQKAHSVSGVSGQSEHTALRTQKRGIH